MPPVKKARKPATKLKSVPEADAAAEFVVDGKTYEIVDLDDLEFGEIELIEDAFGVAAEEIDFRRTKAIRWLVFISMRRAGADVEFEQLAQIKVSDITDTASVNGEPVRPTSPPAE